LTARATGSSALENSSSEAARAVARAARVGCEDHVVPLIDVTYRGSVSAEALRRLAIALPAIVSEAVDCPEDPWIGDPVVGDLEIRFHERSPVDVGDLDCVIEVRTKLFASREQDKQRRVDLITARDAASVDVGQCGVWLVLAEGAWAQTTDDGRP
jgi:hypothetical protein